MVVVVDSLVFVVDACLLVVVVACQVVYSLTVHLLMVVVVAAVVDCQSSDVACRTWLHG